MRPSVTNEWQTLGLSDQLYRTSTDGVNVGDSALPL